MTLLKSVTFSGKVHDLECVWVHEHCSRHNGQVSFVAVA